MDGIEYHGAEAMLCATCQELPERDGPMVRCSSWTDSTTCIVRVLVGWAPIQEWNALMVEVSDKRVEASKVS